MTLATRTLPADGATIAVDAVPGVGDLQLAKIVHGAEGEAHLASAATPVPIAAYGEMMETLQAMRMTMEAMMRTFGMMMPDTAGRMRVSLDAMPFSLTLTTVSGVNTVGAVTNQAQLGGFSANDQIPALMRMSADALRRNIVVS